MIISGNRIVHKWFILQTKLFKLLSYSMPKSRASVSRWNESQNPKELGLHINRITFTVHKHCFVNTRSTSKLLVGDQATFFHRLSSIPFLVLRKLQVISDRYLSTRQQLKKFCNIELWTSGLCKVNWKKFWMKWSRSL